MRHYYSAGGYFIPMPPVRLFLKREAKMDHKTTNKRNYLNATLNDLERDRIRHEAEIERLEMLFTTLSSEYHEDIIKRRREAVDSLAVLESEIADVKKRLEGLES